MARTRMASRSKGAVSCSGMSFALRTTYPAQAMLGRLPPQSLGVAVVGALAFSWLSRRVWLRSIGRYTSASS